MMTRQRLAATLAALALAAGLGLTATGSATAAPVTASKSASTESVPLDTFYCGFYDGNAQTVYGDSGNRVREVQCLLDLWSFDLGTSGPNHDGVDGDFGSKTLTAVKAFQTRERTTGCSIKLTVDGKVGTHTWSALRHAGGCPTV